MKTITDLFRAFGAEYLEKYKNVDFRQMHVMEAIVRCRSGHYGMSFHQCGCCGSKHIFPSSCGNRHCPACQNHKIRQWLESQVDRALPVHYFMVTFTVQSEFKRIIKKNRKKAYDAFFEASSGTIKTLAARKRPGNLPGFFGVLHTWDRQIGDHPHIHYIVAGGCLSEDGKWMPEQQNYFLPVEALSRMFKARFLEGMRKEGLLEGERDGAWDKPWVVNVQAVGSCENSIGYLAPYVFKSAITNSRIVSIEDRQVTFRYRKGKSNRWRRRTMEVLEFIRLYLQHVLPKGFMKVRHYGFMHQSSRHTLEEVRAAIEEAAGLPSRKRERKEKKKYVPSCPDCGGALEYLLSVIRGKVLIFGKPALNNTG